MDFDDGKCKVDMVVHLAGGKAIAFEHKIDAPETPGPESEKPDQLKRYLALEGIDGVAYVRASWKPPGKEVMEDPKYVRPPDRQHFVWHDLY
ncbi:MAG: hypothetical protein WAN48_09035, partial [Actinomycetes bacterium]